jgi:formylglycine-generating enzyme required for sulfatase activity
MKQKRRANRVYRGGSWDYDAAYCHAANRYDFVPGSRSDFIGFRCMHVKAVSPGRAYRGGCWFRDAAIYRDANRYRGSGSARGDLGFRCARRRE